MSSIPLFSARVLMALALGSGVLATACGASTDTPASEPAQTPAPMPTQQPNPTPKPEPTPSACDVENAALQKGIDLAHAKDTEAVLSIRNPACGARTLVSGPTKIDGTRLHRIGSVTKTYVAAVILGLVKDGALTLDDKVSKWVPDVTNGDVITIRQLLDHSSGLFNYTDDADFRKSPLSKVWTPTELVAVSTKNPVYFAPGTSWHYSNTNFIILGMIAEAAGKAKIGALVRTRVFEKAGLVNTFFDGEETIKGTLAPAQDTNGGDATTVLNPSWAWSAGAMVATPGDVAIWIEKVGSGTFYDTATQKELLTTVPTDQPGIDYGLGIMVFGSQLTGGGGEGIGHGGDIPGYHTQAFYFPDKKTTIVSIVDSDAENPNDLSIVALDVLFGKKK
jgi:D-alanyl-D-alanine carboxypeptidase